MPPTYRVRPGLWSDVPAASDLYLKSFWKEPLLDYMFPSRHTDPVPFNTWIHRRFQLRYWTPGYFLTMAIAYNEENQDENADASDGSQENAEKKEIEKRINGKGEGRPVGLTWWHRPVQSFSFYERWLSPSAWFSWVVYRSLKLYDYLRPIPDVDAYKLGIYDRVFAKLGPQILNSERRQGAWYLATLGVDPTLQKGGIGGMLLRDGLVKVDAAGAASWLVGLQGLESYYENVGFVEVARANVGELEDWQGGSVMFRND